MAAHQAGVGQASLARHIQEWRAALGSAFSTDKHVYQTFGNGHQHGVLVPAYTAYNCWHLPLQCLTRPHTYYGRHLRHIRLFRERTGFRSPRKFEARPARNGREVERQDPDRHVALCVHDARRNPNRR